MTPSAVAELVTACRLPDGYEMRVEPQRKYQARNLWSIRIFKDGERVFGRAAYPSSLPAAIVTAQAVAWAMSRSAAGPQYHTDTGHRVSTPPDECPRCVHDHEFAARTP